MFSNTSDSQTKQILWFIAIFSYITLWWLWAWPAQMGWDSAVYIRAGIMGRIDSLHSHLYSFVINQIVIPSMRVSFLAFLQVVFASIVLARIFTMLWLLRPPFWAKAWAILSLLSPLTSIMAIYIIGDSFFVFAMTGLLFETWLIAFRGKCTRTGWLLIACCSPLALFSRENGKILAVLLPALTWNVFQRREWIILSGCLLSCLLLGTVLSAWLVPGQRHPAILPVAAQEMANFARALPRQAAGAGLSEESREFLARIGQTPERLADFYHPYYWDYVGFIPEGPRLLQTLKPEEALELNKLFLTRELWKNLPRFLGHRVEVFLAMSLAKSAHADPAQRLAVMDSYGIKLNEKIGSRLPVEVKNTMDKLYQAGYRYRWLFWNALPAVFFLCLLIFQGGWRHSLARIVLVPLAVQMLGIFSLAPAAEYRYVFFLFLSVPLLLVVWKAQR